MRDMVDNHWPAAKGGNLYKKEAARSVTGAAPGGRCPPNPDGLLDGWSKQNNSAANDWTRSDAASLHVWQTVAAPHFPGAPPATSAKAMASAERHRRVERHRVHRRRN